MTVKLNQIKGLMVEKKSISSRKEYRDSKDIGFNEALDQQGNRSIGLSREKGIKAILKLWTKYDRLRVQKTSDEEAGDIIDAIIKELPNLLEVGE